MFHWLSQFHNAAKQQKLSLKKKSQATWSPYSLILNQVNNMKSHND